MSKKPRIFWQEASSDDLGGAEPFSEKMEGLARVLPALCLVRVSCPKCPMQGCGTAALLGTYYDVGGVFATAAHVVRDEWTGEKFPEIRLRFEGTEDDLSARVVGETRWHGPGRDADVAILETKDPLPEEAEGLTIDVASEPFPLEEGTRVAYAGYALPDDSGSRRLMVARGVIGGHRFGKGPDGSAFNRFEYIVDGMVNPGMSGGPMFCPNTGVAAGIIAALEKPVKGHGWSYALPIEVARAMLQD